MWYCDVGACLYYLHMKVLHHVSIVFLQVDNQLLGTTQPVMLYMTPGSNESNISDSGAALQVNSVKVPSNLILTDLFKVNDNGCVS